MTSTFCWKMVTSEEKSTFSSKNSSYSFVLAAAFSMLCIGFVPVVIVLGWYSSVIPLSVVLMSFVEGSAKSWTLWKICYIVFYSGIFFGFGFFVSSVICSRTKGRFRFLLSSVLVLAPMAATFLPVLTYNGPKGSGGTYTFWGATVRYFHVYSEGELSINQEGEQDAEQPATAPKLKFGDEKKSKPESEGRSQ